MASVGGGAAGGFVTRAFDAMLKETFNNKKFSSFNTAIHTYLDIAKDLNQQSTAKKENHAASSDGVHSRSPEIDGPPEMDKDISISSSATNDAEHKETAVSSGEPITAALANAGHTLGEAEAEIVLHPIRLAFETKNMKIIELALDCLHKLVAYDHLEGDPGLEAGRNAMLFTDILNMVCSCVDNSSPDSTTLQVLKVLLTAVASAKFRVHGEPLLGVIRVCYNIALNSKSMINQATSKAMLTQMLNIVFKRMETELVHTSSNFVAHGPIPEDGSRQIVEEAPSSENEELTSTDPPSTKDASIASVDELQNLVGGADIKGLEAVLEKAVHLEDGEKVSRGIDLDSLSIGERDALLLFRTLCKMGMKEDIDEVTSKTRILSLELLQALLEGVSQEFTKNFNFIDSVKGFLSYVLLRASVSQSHVIFQYATGIFSVLLLRFRESLKGEICVFFPVIVLRSLDSSDLNPKSTILRMLEKICKEPQMLVDLYVNYDCDLQAPNLFEHMVTTLSKIAQGTQHIDSNSTSASQTGLIKTSSLQCLVNVLKSLVDWEKSQRELKKQNSEHSSEEVLDGESTNIKGREDMPSNFEKLKAHKSTVEAAVSEFNRHAVKGIEYLISSKIVESKPASVAEFLKSTPNLDKAMIGDYLGQHEDFPLAVMHSYVDSMNFSGLKFDGAIREFLKGFRLPGEAQKIDRIMEKFAERYCADNPDIFKNADTAYVLAYAVIMLNTDAHNPMVWPKMSKDDFVRINALNDAEESAPKDLLEEIYDSIVKEEIKMKDARVSLSKAGKQKTEEEGGALVGILNLALPRSNSPSESKNESEGIIEQTRDMIRKQKGLRGVFYVAQEVELVRPMIEALGWPLLATLSVNMEEGDSKPRIYVCMDGFKAAIQITHVLGMDTMRYAYLTSLIRYNFLHVPKDMRTKNVEALRTLLDLCDSDTAALQDSWIAIVECISRLEYITSSPSMMGIVMQGANQISRDSIIQSLKELAGKPAERVFVISVKLPSEAVVEFFTALCNTSAQELRQMPPRVFSLQKLVEISYYNMARIRMVWARIWSVLASHFITAGSHSDEKVAMYAIDSLRQLGMKYLERAELANFTFQNEILKPFVVLMRNGRSESLRSLIVDCIVQMIKSKVASIKSGWKSVFMIFTAAADDELEHIVESAFENVEQVILEHFDQVVGDCFMDCVNCLIRFANNKCSPRISLKAIALLRICEDRLAEGRLPGGALKPIDTITETTDDMTEHYWFPMLAGLSDLTSDTREEVRSCALEVLFDLLNERGVKFSSKFWESVFYRVLFPIFDHVRHAGRENVESSSEEWLRESSVHSLQLLCNLFNTFYKCTALVTDKLQNLRELTSCNLFNAFYKEVCFMLPPLLGLLLDCAKKTDQSVVSLSLGALVHLIEVGGHQFSDSDWDTLLKSIRDATYATQPLELLNDLGLEISKRRTSLARGLYIPSLDKQQSVASEQGDVPPLDSLDTVADDTTTRNNAPVGTENDDVGRTVQMEGPEGTPSPSGKWLTPANSSGLHRNQTIGQKIMGNMMDNVLVRSFTSKSKNSASELVTPSSPPMTPDTIGPEEIPEEESSMMGTIRSKCITQLLLLGVIDSIQKKYWNKLNASQKTTIMDILFSVLEFAAAYNSYSTLRQRMHQIPSERPPLNLLRQELDGTCIYLDILHKSTAEIDSKVVKSSKTAVPQNGDIHPVTNDANPNEIVKHERFKGIAEEKLVSFCGQVLREASEFQSGLDESSNMEIHRVLELRSPIVVKVIKGMCSMNSQIFKSHLIEFHPFITKLVCCDQMDVRGALSELFNMQLSGLVR